MKKDLNFLLMMIYTNSNKCPRYTYDLKNKLHDVRYELEDVININDDIIKLILDQCLKSAKIDTNDIHHLKIGSRNNELFKSSNDYIDKYYQNIPKKVRIVLYLGDNLSAEKLEANRKLKIETILRYEYERLNIKPISIKRTSSCNDIQTNKNIITYEKLWKLDDQSLSDMYQISRDNYNLACAPVLYLFPTSTKHIDCKNREIICSYLFKILNKKQLVSEI
jgi:hypothetical protein